MKDLRPQIRGLAARFKKANPEWNQKKCFMMAKNQVTDKVRRKP